MIYLASVHGDDLALIEDRFRSGGIPIYIEPDFSSKESVGAYNGVISQPTRYRINICLDEQLEDAKHLFADPNYKVKEPVDVSEFERAMEQLGATRDSNQFMPIKGLYWIVGIILIGFAAWFLHASGAF